MLDQIPLKLDREGIKEREDDEKGSGVGGRGGGSTIIRGRRLFLIFPPKGGDYSREAIYRGTAIIRGNTVLLQ